MCDDLGAQVRAHDDVGCAAPGAEPGDGDGADIAGADVIDVSLGESLSGLEVRAVSAGSEASPPPGTMLVFRLDLDAGQSFVAAMTATSLGLDSHLVLKSPSKATLATGDRQALLPMALDSDAVVSFTAREAGEHYLFATGGPNMQIADYAARDLVLEQADGTLGEGGALEALPRSERVAVRQRIADVNGLRADYFSFAAGPADPTAVARSIAEVWIAYRTAVPASP